MVDGTSCTFESRRTLQLLDDRDEKPDEALLRYEGNATLPTVNKEPLVDDPQPWQSRSVLTKLAAPALVLLPGLAAILFCASRMHFPLSAEHDDSTGVGGSQQLQNRDLFVVSPTYPALKGKIRHHDGRCLDVDKVVHGEVAVLKKCSVHMVPDHQAWKYEPLHHHITNKHGMCLDAGPGAIHLWKCDTGNKAQLFNVNFGFLQIVRLVQKRGGLFMTDCLESLANGGVHLSRCTCCAWKNQWNVPREFGEIRQVRGKCLSMAALDRNGARVHVEDCQSSHHHWHYNHRTSQLRLSSQLCLEAPKLGNSHKIARVAKCAHAQPRQRFRLYASGQIVAHNSLCLTAQQPTVGNSKIGLWPCNRHSQHQRWRTASPYKRHGHARPSRSHVPTLDFYMYRAASGGKSGYPFGDLNTGNLAGVMFYLMNEVVTEYNKGPRCPRKFNIDSIHRYRIRMKPTAALFSEGMHFGIRFAYDAGKCSGRCFPEDQCTGSSDCAYHYARFGHFVGCNEFKDNYPFPKADLRAPGGTWYSLPLKGRCAHPTGSPDCTWSFEHAGVVKLSEIENIQLGSDNCCNGVCTDFWSDPWKLQKAAWRIEKTFDTFHRKFSHWPRNLEAKCDFNWHKWYSPSQDHWKPHDIGNKYVSP